MNLIHSFLLFVGFYLCFFVVKIAVLIIPKVQAKDGKKVLFLSPFFPENAGYIYRTQKWAEILIENGYEVDIKTTVSKEQFYKYLINNDIRFYLISLFKRVWQVLTSRKYDVVIVMRELLLFNDYGDLFLEKALLKIHPNAILDFDDDISFAKGEPRKIKSTFGKLMLENGTKFKDSLRLYKNFIAGSNYLKNLVLAENKQINEKEICVVPTCVDYESHPQKKYSSKKKTRITLGWIGSNGNLRLLEEILTQINEVHKDFPIKLIIISGKQINPNVDFEVENRMWSYETQFNDLLDIDIGLMPLNETLEDKGKCGFKLIQYMGLGIVSVASSVTVNKEIVADNVFGFLVENKKDWTKILLKVLNSQKKFQQIGESARQRIQDNYSFLANKNKYIDFLENLSRQ